jgi:hypothetical protein
VVKYRHTLVYRIDGIHLGAREPDVEVVSDLAMGIRAVLTSDPDERCLEADRFTALANLRLNARFGEPGLRITEARVAEELEDVRRSRRRTFGSGPYLVFVREDEIEDFSALREGEYEDFEVYSNGPPKEPLRRASKSNVLTVLAALAVAVDVSGVDEISDTVVFYRGDGKPMYSYTLSMTANPSVSHAILEEAIGSVEDWYRALAGHEEVQRVVRLLVSSLQTEGDKLRSFLSAWAAIEILTNKTYGSYVEGLFRELDLDDQADARRRYLGRVRSAMSDKYRLTDKFALMAATLCPESADEDITQIERAKKERDKLAQGQDVQEAYLPVEAVRGLVRRYLRLYLAS